MIPRRFLPILALALLAGCAGPPKAPAPEVVLPAISGKFERRLADGTWAVAANLKNGSAAAVTVQVGCQFLGAGGQPLGGPMQWQTVTVAAAGMETVHFAAKDAAASAETLAVKPL